MITRRFLHRRCPGSVLGNPVTITKGKQKKIVYRYRDRKIKKSCYPCTQISLRLTLGRRKSGFEIYLNTRFIVNGVWKCSFLWIFVEYCHPNSVRSPLKLTSWLLAFGQHEFLLNVSSSLHREPIGSLLCRRPSGLVTHSFRDERKDRERLGPVYDIDEQHSVLTWVWCPGLASWAFTLHCIYLGPGLSRKKGIKYLALLLHALSLLR